MSHLDALTESERDALSQLQAITNGADIDTQISLLQSVNWDVQAATQAIYGDERVPTTTTSQTQYEEIPRNIEPMEVDDSLVFGARTPPSSSSTWPASRAFPQRAGAGLGIFSLLTAPFSLTLHFVASLFHFVFRVLRIPFPRLNTLNLSFNRSFGQFNRSARRGSYSDDPSIVAERWVRELEEETGAVCISKAAAMDAQENGNGNASTSAIATGSEAGPSNRAIPVKRHATQVKTLPDFFLGGYDAALRAAQRDARVLCVIITSEEHDDVPEFKRNVLTDPEFVKTLTDNHIIVWGGDARERDGYQAAMKLHATTYPFVAFISLYARIDGSDTMTVITRHSGPPSTITSAETLSGHIVNTVLPRVAPVLNRKHAEKRARDSERRLREEQDRAYAESQRKDYERIMRRREEEQRQRDEEERQKHEAAERVRKVEEKLAWRRYARRNLVPSEVPGSKTSMRIGVRLPSGKQLIRKFEPTDSITILYAFVASQLIPAANLPEDDPVEPPSQDESDFDLDNHDWDWEFKLAVAFPKTAIGWTRGDHTKIGEVPALKGGANLVVEMERPMEFVESSQAGVDEDETESEDDDE